jgi:hypothetical protein
LKNSDPRGSGLAVWGQRAVGFNRNFPGSPASTQQYFELTARDTQVWTVG